MSSEQLRVSLIATLDATFAAYTSAGQSPGLVYGLVQQSGLTHSRGFGTVEEGGAVPDLDTVFPIASMTKSFVACAALIARDRGLIDLEASIRHYIPEYPAGSGADDEAPTVRMLLSMSGGLTEDNAWVDPLTDVTPEDLLAQLAEGVCYSSVPGTNYEYSNLGYALAGLAIGRAVGRTIEEYIIEEICTPLGMSQTWFDGDVPDPSTWTRAVGHALNDAGQWVPFSFAPSGAALAAAGGMLSTVRDVAVWISWLSQAFRPKDDDEAQILSRPSRREMQRLHQIDLPHLHSLPSGALRVSVSGYALGLVTTYDLRYGTVIAHAGGVPGYKLYMCWHLDSGMGIVCLTNSHRGDPIALAHNALMIALDYEAVQARTVRLWPETVAMRQKADALVRSWGDEAAKEIFAENVAFDRPLSERQKEIAELLEAVGPLLPPGPANDTVSSSSPADITWALRGERGELICMIHLTPLIPPRIQEFEVRAISYAQPRSARLYEISERRAKYAAPSMSASPNVRLVFP